ncbi:hypothetical protein SRABI27_03735 [Pedobacter sp. Bi27]|uniref:alpha/beta hydrolase n=1 Tax=Pedobacter sp. Bi27 TaxID=2822351 RepID=UPI001E0050E7|nr:alpha/beta hydrolase [Pedobacter sp. Bi27]CAH0279595.1 hypothetical protein SRABI27_03735 [Pedobacter sp. Bi27]
MKKITANFEISLRADPDTGQMAPSIRIKGLLPQNGTDLILLVHGFNNTQKASSDNYKSFTDKLTRQAGMENYPAVICPFYWPSNRRNALVSAASYVQQLKKSLICARMLADYLLWFTIQRPQSRLIFIGHSMGCRLILEAITFMESKRPWSGPRLSLIALMAAAVPTGMLRPGGRLSAIRENGKRFLGLSSTKDLMLASVFPSAQTLAREGLFPAAVGYKGEPWDLWNAGATDTSLAHTAYWSSTDAGSKVGAAIGLAHIRTLNERKLTERKLNTYSFNRLESG